MEEKKIKYLVADTTAFINVIQLHEYAENIFTVPDVIEEVKNKRQIRRLVVLPFDLQVREPRSDYVKIVRDLSKKTGDYASLSAIDLKVIALTYELEAEHVGTEHIRTIPVVSKVVASKEKPEEFVDNTKLVGFYVPKKGLDNFEAEAVEDKEAEDKHNLQNLEEKDEITDEEGQSEELNGQDEDDHNDDNEWITPSNFKEVEKNLEENDEITEEELEKCFAKLKCDPSQEENCDILKPTSDGDGEESADEEGQSEESDGQDEDDYNDDSGWITPSNIKKVKKNLEGIQQDEVVPSVACMSTDFAIQNVLKQMNLNISALNGRVIKHLRTYVLRCYTCFKTTSVISKMFCPNCGNKTLKKVAVSLDENGQQVIHINTKRPLTAKYKNQSLPRFKGGKHSRNPILFEDQPMPRQMPSRVAKTKTNALDEDYVAGYSPFVVRDVDSKSALLRSKGNIKDWARNNEFEEARRRKHYNRLVK